MTAPFFVGERRVRFVASRIQGITVEIGGDTTKLYTALSKVNKEIRDTQAQLKDVNKLLKLDPGNAELMPVTAAVGGLSAAAVKVASDFDSAMSQVAAVSGAMRTMLTSLTGEVTFVGDAFGELMVQTTNAEALVGKNAMSGFLAVMNAAPGDIEKLNNAINNCDGTAERMVETMQDNLVGQLTILKSQLEELAISIGEILLPSIRQIVGWIQGLVDWLNGLDEGTKKVIVTVALVAATLGPGRIPAGRRRPGLPRGTW